MATDQVHFWLKNDVKLTQDVSNFETAFSSGYLFGEILTHYGIFDNISEFSQKKNKEAVVNNFYKVEDALRLLKVKFDGKQIHNIMQEERGAALRLLFQLKLGLAKQFGDALANFEGFQDPNTMSMSNLKMTKVNDLQTKKLERTMNKANSVTHATTRGQDQRSEKQKVMDKHTVGFQVTKLELFDKALADHMREQELVRSIQTNNRSKQREKLAENQQFMRDWQSEGMKNWQINQDKMASLRAKNQYFEDREVSIYKNKLNSELEAATKEAIEGVNDFEKNLQKLGIEQNTNMEDAIKKMDEKKGIPPGQIQNFSYAATINKIKESKKQTDFAGKERERRRRKLQVDQARTQVQLEQQKNENDLLQKLLKRQSDLHAEGTANQRQRFCKQMAFENRKKSQLEREEERETEHAKMEKKAIEKSRLVEADRKKELENQKQKNVKVALEKKLQKRAVNIEIGSALMDLIVDVADQTYETTHKNPNHKVSKKDWREYMDVFKQGKRVTARNVVKKPVHEEASEVSTHMLEFRNDQSVNGLCFEFQESQALADLMQFICGIGSFNLAEIEGDLWKQVQTHEVECKSNFLCQNPDLGDCIEQLYQAEELTEVVPTAVPKDFGLKLCLLGRAFSGKKTISKQIQSLFGDKNIRVFDMDEIVKEALDYINPKKPDPVPEKPVKGKKPNKQEEVVVTDPFEGKNTVEYKEVANQIKSAFFGDVDLAIVKKLDCSTQVLDDELLVNLFIEKIKLTFEADKSSETMEAEIAASLKREKEILAQLAEIEQANANVVQDTKSKKAPKKNEKVNVEEQLQNELAELRKFKPNGWILLDFPRNLNQAKLLEKSLTGFEQKIDRTKDSCAQSFDAWAKLITPKAIVASDFSGEVAAQQSGFDSYVFLQTPSAECSRRTTGRKIDPLTQTVYHVEDFPPPTDDKKLTERIQDFNDEAAEANRVHKNHVRFERTIENIASWSENFGLTEEGTVDCAVKSTLIVNDLAWRSKEEVFNVVKKHIQQIVDFKQNQFNRKRQEVEMKLANPAVISVQSADTMTEQMNTQESNYKVQDKLDKMSISQDQYQSSHMRSSKMAQRIQDLNEKQKLRKWDDTLISYYREGIQWFQMLNTQRERVFKQLNDSQRRYIEFLSRPSQMQKRINDFCDSYNRFSAEFPQLWTNPQTKTELLNRVEILSNQLWVEIQERKDQSVAEREKLIEGGWAHVEKVRVCSFIAYLLENEIQKFQVIVAIVTGSLLNEETDLPELVRRLAEKEVSSFENNGGKRSSPLLNEVILAASAHITTVLSENYMLNLDRQAVEMLQTEKDNLNLRVNSLKTYALLLLDEISFYSNQVFDVLDDWIVVAVEQENLVSQLCVKEIKIKVESGVKQIDSVLLKETKLFNKISTNDFKPGPPLYMKRARLPTQINDRRFELQHLYDLYHQFRFHSADQSLIDAQMMITLLVLNLQARTVPDLWRYLSFSKFFSLVNSFKALPLSDDPDNQQLFEKSVSDDLEAPAQFVDWKLLLTAFTLVGNESSQESIDEYETALSNAEKNETGLLTLENFLKVPAWFDDFEGSHDPVAKIREDTDDTEEEEEKLDEARIKEVKTLLFQTHRKVNETCLRPSVLIGALRELAKKAKNKSFFASLFGAI